MVEYAIEITPTALRDIDEAFDYIAFHLENPQAAYDLIDAIYLGIGDLSSMPERFPAWKREPMKSKGVRKKQHMVSVFRVIYNRRDV